MGKVILSSDKSYIIFYETEEEKNIYKILMDFNKEAIIFYSTNQPKNIFFEIDNIIIIIEKDLIKLFYFHKNTLNIIDVNKINITEIEEFKKKIRDKLQV